MMLGQRKTQTSSCNVDRMTIRHKKQAQVFIYHETYETETLKLNANRDLCSDGKFGSSHY